MLMRIAGGCDGIACAASEGEEYEDRPETAPAAPSSHYSAFLSTASGQRRVFQKGSQPLRARPDTAQVIWVLGLVIQSMVRLESCFIQDRARRR